MPSGWAAETSDGEGKHVDRLRNLGQAQNYNINVDHGEFSVVCSLVQARIVKCPSGQKNLVISLSS